VLELADCLPDDTTVWSKYCQCWITLGGFSVLECSNSSMLELPANFNSSLAWSYVNLVGSSVSRLRKYSFKFLRLAENATIAMSGVQSFDEDAFSFNMNLAGGRFRLLLDKCSLRTLSSSAAFRSLRISELECRECFVDQIDPRSFNDTHIEALVFRRASADSLSPFVRPFFFFTLNVRIRKLQFVDIYDTYRANSGYFQLDSYVLSRALFAHLEELELKNTYVDALDSNAFEQLPRLRVIRFENVRLKSIVIDYLSSIEAMGEWTSTWLSSLATLERVYLGREQLNELGFRFDDDAYVCYFAHEPVANPDRVVYLYDAGDSSSGLRCTCSIYAIYWRSAEALRSLLANDDPDALRYVPECVRKLFTGAVVDPQQQLLNLFNRCTNNNTDSLEQYCINKHTQTTTTTTTTTTTRTIATMTTSSTINIVSTTNTTQMLATSNNSVDSTATNSITSSSSTTSTTTFTSTSTTPSTTTTTASTTTSSPDSLAAQLSNISSFLTVIIVLISITLVLGVGGGVAFLYITRKLPFIKFNSVRPNPTNESVSANPVQIELQPVGMMQSYPQAQGS
jgi:hypothetical protein